MANSIPFQLKKVIIRALVDGMSIRQIEALTGVHRDRIVSLLHRIGDYCKLFTTDNTVDSKGAELPPLCAEHLKVIVREKWKASLELDGIPVITTLNVVSVLSFPTTLVLHYVITEDNDADTIYQFLDDLGMCFHAPYVDSHGFKRFAKNQTGSEEQTVVESLVNYIGNLQEAPLIGYARREKAWQRVNAYTGLGTLSFFRKNNTSFPRSLETFDAVVAIYMMYYNYLRVHPLLDATPAYIAGVIDDESEIDFIDVLGSDISEDLYCESKDNRITLESMFRD